MENYRILIVEDEVLIAEDIQFSLVDLGYDVCEICYDSESALDAIYKLRPDMVMLDINIRGSRDGIEIAQIISDQYQLPFIFLSSLSDRNTLERAKKTRPRGYLTKPFKDRDLMTTIEMAIFNHREDILKKSLSKELVDRYCESPMSTKEFEIFEDLLDGLNNTQIGNKHFISVNTVKTHIKRIFTKLDVHDRVSAVRKVLT